MAEPPVEVGAVQVSATEAFPKIASTAVGALGAVAGVTAEEAVDATLVPALLVAVTAKV